MGHRKTSYAEECQNMSTKICEVQQTNELLIFGKILFNKRVIKILIKDICPFKESKGKEI